MLKWVSDKPSSTFAVCMENPYRPYALQEKRANKLGYGENGFSQYMQHEGTLLGLYAVPETVKVRNHTFEYPYNKLYAPFPATGSIVKRIEKDGWVFCHAGSMLFGFFASSPTSGTKSWGDHDMLWCDARKNGWILETSELAPFAGGGADAELDRFAEAVITENQARCFRHRRAGPSMTYRALSGKTLEFTLAAPQGPLQGPTQGRRRAPRLLPGTPAQEPDGLSENRRPAHDPARRPQAHLRFRKLAQVGNPVIHGDHARGVVSTANQRQWTRMGRVDFSEAY